MNDESINFDNHDLYEYVTLQDKKNKQKKKCDRIYISKDEKKNNYMNYVIVIVILLLLYFAYCYSNNTLNNTMRVNNYQPMSDNLVRSYYLA